MISQFLEVLVIVLLALQGLAVVIYFLVVGKNSKGIVSTTALLFAAVLGTIEYRHAGMISVFNSASTYEKLSNTNCWVIVSIAALMVLFWAYLTLRKPVSQFSRHFRDRHITEYGCN